MDKLTFFQGGRKKNNNKTKKKTFVSGKDWRTKKIKEFDPKGLY